MHRLLLSIGLAVLVGGIAVAVNADQHFGDQPTVTEPLARPESADRPRVISDLPLTGQAIPGQPEIDGTAAQQAETPSALACRREEMLVKFKPGADAATVAARYGATIVSSIPQIGVYVLAVPPGTQAAALAGLSADLGVEYAEPNGVVRIPELPPTPDPCAVEPASTAEPIDDSPRRPAAL